MTTYYGFYDSTGKILRASSVDETQFASNDISTFLTNISASPYNSGLSLYTSTTTPFNVDDHYLVIDGSTSPATLTLTSRPVFTAICQWNKTITSDGVHNTAAMSANGTDTLTFSAIPTTGSALPNPTSMQMTIPAGLGLPTIQTGTITDGAFGLTVPASGAGKYTITLSAFPYVDYTLTVTAT